MIRAAVLTAPGRLEVMSFPESAPPRDGALLRPTHCGVCGTDPHMYSGHLAVPMPLVMGHEFSGVLEGWGPDFPARDVYGEELHPGEAVAVGTTLACGTCYYCRFVPQRQNLCQDVNIYGITLGADQGPHVRGGYSDLLYLLPQTWLFKLPANVTLKMAALADPIACGTRALERAFAPGMPWAGEGVGLGKSVVVQGLGPIGIMTGAAARAMGASPVIGIDRIPLRLEMARRSRLRRGALAGGAGGGGGQGPGGAVDDARARRRRGGRGGGPAPRVRRVAPAGPQGRPGGRVRPLHRQRHDGAQPAGRREPGRGHPRVVRLPQRADRHLTGVPVEIRGGLPVRGPGDSLLRGGGHREGDPGQPRQGLRQGDGGVGELRGLALDRSSMPMGVGR